MQMRKARDFQRLAEREHEGQGGAAPGYRGPDGSGQWVSMGELGDNDLDSVLGSLGGGEQLTDNRTMQHWKCIRYNILLFILALNPSCCIKKSEQLRPALTHKQGCIFTSVISGSVVWNQILGHHHIVCASAMGMTLTCSVCGCRWCSAVSSV